MESSEASIRAMLTEIGNCPEDADAGADIYTDLGLASVHAMLLLTAIEDRFGIHLPDDDFIEARSIAGLSQLVDTLRNGSAEAHA